MSYLRHRTFTHKDFHNSWGSFFLNLFLYYTYGHTIYIGQKAYAFLKYVGQFRRKNSKTADNLLITNTINY